MVEKDEPIRFLEWIGLDNEQLKDFTIRLNEYS